MQHWQAEFQATTWKIVFTCKFLIKLARKQNERPPHA